VRFIALTIDITRLKLFLIIKAVLQAMLFLQDMVLLLISELKGPIATLEFGNTYAATYT
jgi:hypothetical protein